MDGIAPASNQPKPIALDIDSLRNHMVTVKVDKEDVTVTLEQALNGFMMQSDYVRKTQALSERSTAFAGQENHYNELVTFMKDLEANPAGAIQKLQWHYGIDPESTPAGDDGDTPPEVIQMQAEIARMRSQLEQATASTQGMAAEQQLRSEFPEIEAEEVRSYLRANGMPEENLLQGAKLIDYDRLAERTALTASAEASQLAAIQAARESKLGLPPVSPGAAPTPSPDLLQQPAPALPTFDEAVDLALQELGTGTLLP